MWNAVLFFQQLLGVWSSVTLSVSGADEVFLVVVEVVLAVVEWFSQLLRCFLQLSRCFPGQL